MSNNQKKIESDLPGFYYDEEKKKYYRITPAHLSNPLHPEKIRRIEGHRESVKKKDDLIKLKTVSIPRKFDALEYATRIRFALHDDESMVLR